MRWRGGDASIVAHSVSINRILSRSLFADSFRALSGRRIGNTTRTMWVTTRRIREFGIRTRRTNRSIRCRRDQKTMERKKRTVKWWQIPMDYIIDLANDHLRALLCSRVSKLTCKKWSSPVVNKSHGVIIIKVTMLMRISRTPWQRPPPQDSKVMSSDQMDRMNGRIIWFLN